MLVRRFKGGRDRRDAARLKRARWIREFVRRARVNPHYAAEWVATHVAPLVPAGAPVEPRFDLEIAVAGSFARAGSFDLVSSDGRRIYFSARADVTFDVRWRTVETSFLAWDGARMVERPVPAADEEDWPIGPGESAIVGRAATLEAWDPIASRLSLRSITVLSRVSRGMRDIVRGLAAVASRVPVEWRGYAGNSDLKMATLFSIHEMPHVRFTRVPNDQDLMRAVIMGWFTSSRNFRGRDLQLRIRVAPNTLAVPVLRIHVGSDKWLDVRMRTPRAKFFNLGTSLSGSWFTRKVNIRDLAGTLRR